MLAAECVIVLVCSPSSIASSKATTFTGCGISALPGVKVSMIGVPAPAPRSVWLSGVIVTSTFAVGSESSTTVYVSLRPPSSTSVDPPDSAIVT